MPATSLFQQARKLTRFVLLGFAMSLAAAMASPLVNPTSTELICTSTGAMKLMVIGEDGNAQAQSAGMDCPLCLNPSAPPPFASDSLAPSQRSLSHVLRPLAAAPIAALTAAPLPARGPPQIS